MAAEEEDDEEEGIAEGERIGGDVVSDEVDVALEVSGGDEDARSAIIVSTSSTAADIAAIKDMV